MSVRLTAAQAIVRYLMAQCVDVDGTEQRFSAGMWGIFGHGSIGGVAEAWQEAGPAFPYCLGLNEHAMVHGEPLSGDFEALCRGHGADALTVKSRSDLEAALQQARTASRTPCIVVPIDWHKRVPGYPSCWWDMATAHIATLPAVRTARREYEREKARQRYLMIPGHPYGAASYDAAG